MSVIRVAHVISNLSIGGAEQTLCSLVETTAGRGIHHTVISIIPGGPLKQRLERAGATVIELRGRRGIAGVLSVLPLARAIRDCRPDAVHAWMYHANMAVAMLQRLGSIGVPSIWSIRQSAENPRLDRILTRQLIKGGAWLSASSAAIVYNSEVGARSHEKLGYAADRRVIINNGVDASRFRPQPDVRATLRAALNLPAGATLIGRVARFAPMKDFPTLLKAFARTLRDMPGAQLLLVGEGISPANSELVALCRSTGCLANVHLLGPRRDIEQLYPALDVLVSSSAANEGFPNVIAEALACGVAVVATLSGEEELMRRGVHVVVAPGDFEALAAGMLQVLALPEATKQSLGDRGRAFIQSHYTLDALAERHMALYLRVARVADQAPASQPAFAKTKNHQ